MAARLPIELLDRVTQYASMGSQARLSSVSRDVYYVSARVLYESIPRMSISRVVQCLVTLSANPGLACLVRSFSLQLSSSQVLRPFRTLLASALRNMNGLHTLSLLFGRFAISSVLSQVSCRLTKFVCAVATSGDSYPISQFLMTQPTIEGLNIYCPPNNMSGIGPEALPALRSLAAPLWLLPKIIVAFRLPHISRLSVLGEMMDVQDFVLLGAIFELGKPPESMELAIDLDITAEQMDPLNVSAGLALLGKTAPFINVLMLDIFKGQIKREGLRNIFLRPPTLPRFPNLKTLIVISPPPTSCAVICSSPQESLPFSSLPEVLVPTRNTLGNISNIPSVLPSPDPTPRLGLDPTQNLPRPVPNALYDRACHIEILQAWREVNPNLVHVVFPVAVYTYADRKRRKYN
ncbi:hypothetical protein RSAG8_09536, partial [Rhizoctonia solani AG-8 WAC10335]